MKRQKKLKIMIAALATVIFMMPSTVVYAGTTYSDTLLVGVPIGSSAPGFSAQSGLTTSGSSAKAFSDIHASKNVRAGEMGAVARLYQGGTLITATSIQYNQTSTSSLYVSTNMVNESGASWYSQGILYKWNGNGYESIILPKTPTLNTRTLNAKTNSNGETYGSGEFSASDLDLIRARGTNGKNGYVRSVHLEKNVTPQMKLYAIGPKDMKSHCTNRTVKPL